MHISILTLIKDKGNINLGVRGVRGMEGRKAGEGYVMQFQLKTFSENDVKSYITTHLGKSKRDR